MWIHRDISDHLDSDRSAFVQILTGPRQCGKSSLLFRLGSGEFFEITFDDLQSRQSAQRDPAFFFSQHPPPLILDEVQYVPNLFPELKKIIDQLKRKNLLMRNQTRTILYRLTGSDQILMDRSVKETLVGRASFYHLNTLSVHEIRNTFPGIQIQEIMFRGGWPELYANENARPVQYLNDYIRNCIEKEIVLSSGIAKQNEFNTVLGMLAARTGELLNYSDIAKDSGVRSVTVKEWVSILERSGLVYLLRPIESNLNKRLVKAPKIYFWDTGLSVRLQGWLEIQPMMLSRQAGHLFETLVLGEIIKFRNNTGIDFNLSVWRTKDGDEIDFVITNAAGAIIALDSKMGIHSVIPEELPPSLTRAFPKLKELVIVSHGGTKKAISRNCLQVPVTDLFDFLHERLR